MFLFLHGFLGQKEDWAPLFSHFPRKARAIDLPGHGSAPMADDIALAVKKEVGGADFVIGYSAGGRLALELKARFPKDFSKLILLSAHPGLQEEERPLRKERDAQWIEKLHRLPIDTFLEEWYSQDLFASFRSCPLFTEALERRKQQDPKPLAAFMRAYSLAEKSRYDIPEDTILLYGAQDLKYERLYRTLVDVRRVIPIENAGHAVHLENPAACAKVIYEHYRTNGRLQLA